MAISCGKLKVFDRLVLVLLVHYRVDAQLEDSLLQVAHFLSLFVVV